LGISQRLLWQLTKDGQIPCVRVGSGKRRTVLYPVADLESWLTRQVVTAKGGGWVTPQFFAKESDALGPSQVPG
jgi:hypothetical protein